MARDFEVFGLSPVYEARNLEYTYSDGTDALRGLSFTLNEGEVLALAGVNGSGKSTLFMLLMGCLEPSGGEVLYNGENIRDEVRFKLRREVGLLFQNPDDQLFLPTVWEDVAFGPQNLGLADDVVAERVASALCATGMEALAARAPWKLSGGEKTLVALAGLLAMKPRALLLDEPSAGLDPRSRLNLIKIIRQIPCSIIVATHDLDMAIDVCDRVIILKGGIAAGESRIPGLLHDEAFMQSCGLELPLRYACSNCGPMLKRTSYF